jgi:hypothetical protein
MCEDRKTELALEGDGGFTSREGVGRRAQGETGEGIGRERGEKGGNGIGDRRGDGGDNVAELLVKILVGSGAKGRALK